ncbi:LysR family transcriptional regulator [Rhodobacteraceae bacterium NNCM2]|nr:LysR family transcriptional regulator [Coraliihabitans acroporae]
MSDRLRQIEAFLQVARTKNFTRAGNVLGLSQPALSALISKFEEEVGIKLFNRTTRSVSLTEAGANFLPNAERILMDVHLSIYELREVATLINGRIRIAAPPSICSAELPVLISEFAEEFPGIGISVFERPGNAVVDLVANGQCDFGIGVPSSSRPDIQFTGIFKDELLLLCPDNHDLARHDEVEWTALQAYPVIAMESSTSTRRLMDDAIADSGATVNITSEAHFTSTAIGFVRAGLGITIQGSSVLPNYVLDGVKQVKLKNPVMTREFGLLRHVERPLSPASTEFVKKLRRMR